MALVLEPSVELSGEDARWPLLPRDGHICPMWAKLVDFGFYYIMFYSTLIFKWLPVFVSNKGGAIKHFVQQEPGHSQRWQNLTVSCWLWGESGDKTGFCAQGVPWACGP